MSVVLPGTSERALRHDFDIDCNKWNRIPVKVVLDERPFAEGSLRCAHRLQIVQENGERQNFVSVSPQGEFTFNRGDVGFNVSPGGNYFGLSVANILGPGSSVSANAGPQEYGINFNTRF